jgi:hypothetical protein
VKIDLDPQDYVDNVRDPIIVKKDISIFSKAMQENIDDLQEYESC